MSPDDRWRLLHMAEASEQALEFLRDRARDDLESDTMLRMALARAVEIVGEAASKVSPAGREELSDIPWSEIIGMRHRIVHAYFDLNLNILWNTVRSEMPKLLAQLRPHLDSE
jgi:uncharacterized protein with HEPN domain